MNEPISEEAAETIRRMAMARMRAGAIGRFGVGVKSVLVVDDAVVPSESRTTDAFGLEKTRAAGTAMDGQHRLSSLVEWPGVPPTQLRGAASATGHDVRPAWLEPVPYALRRMRARVISDEAAYNAACDTLLVREAAGRHEVVRETTTERRERDDAARRAVLRRSEGRCENPECLLPDLPYRTTTGEPLLEVDHIDNHAAGGRDYPSAMIALCPNCHANKTRGADQDELRERLRAVALRRHQALRGNGRD
ncbi:HNH endonuclease signature motif containing protein [Streptomyces sp. NPDC001848]|uniref:HNH endonuclease signature motif containing protein n=1 Tax=Streptomyces sp. NPDC001848 TaxID=3364618 RepID=UPI0036AA13A2